MNVIAWNEILEDGETCVGAVMEYDRDIDPASLQPDSFEVTGRTLVRAYISDQRKRDYFGRNCTGRYVFLDFSLKDENAVLVNSVPGPVPHQKHPIGCCVRQAIDLRGADGSAIPAWSEAVPVEDSSPEVLFRFQKSDYIDPENGAHLTNFIYVPEDYSPEHKIPVLLYFHKGPDKGSDGYHLIGCQGGSIWASPEEQLLRRCIVIAPQCPPEGDWTDPDTYQLTDYFFAVCHLLFDIIERYNVDTQRIYCVGASMGGMGAWEINKRFPHLFAASIICVGQCNYEGVEILKDSNIWTLHGENDPKSMTGVSDIVDDIRNVGGHTCRAFWDGQLRGEPAEQLALEELASGANIMQTIWQEGTMTHVHDGGWKPVYSNRILREWLFSKVNEHYSTEAFDIPMDSYPVPVPLDLGFDGREVAKIAPGMRHTLALLKDGRVYAWGYNSCGQIGNGQIGGETAAPVLIDAFDGSRIVDVAAGSNFSLALTEQGTVYAWGSNISGQIGSSDTAACFPLPVLVKGLKDAEAVYAGVHYAAVLKKDGTVWSWGHNSMEQLGTGDNFKRCAPVIAAPGGNVVSGIRKLDLGSPNMVMSLTQDGKVLSWGNNEYGHFGSGFMFPRPDFAGPEYAVLEDKPLENIVEIANGYVHCLALDRDGNVYSWGLNRHGELGHGAQETVAVFAMGEKPARVEHIDRVTQVDAGSSHSIALREDGTVWAWGFNAVMGSGALGVDCGEMSAIPVQLPLEHIRHICCGDNHNFAIAEDGAIYGWGNGNNGRIGPRA